MGSGFNRCDYDPERLPRFAVVEAADPAPFGAPSPLVSGRGASPSTTSLAYSAAPYSSILRIWRGACTLDLRACTQRHRLTNDASYGDCALFCTMTEVAITVAVGASVDRAPAESPKVALLQTSEAG